MADRDAAPGIRRTDIYNIHFYEKSPFYGSWRGMHYRIAGESAAADAAADGVDAASDGESANGDGAARQLCVTIWPGPYNFETTDDDLKVSEWFDFSNEGLDAVTEYLNAYYLEHFA